MNEYAQKIRRYISRSRPILGGEKVRELYGRLGEYPLRSDDDFKQWKSTIRFWVEFERTGGWRGR